MTQPDAEAREFCPICAGILRPVDDGLYCGHCDLVYEADGDGDDTQD
jgi:hypothetical protein